MTQKYSIINSFYSLRGGAVAARWAHNPKVAGSSPAPATNTRHINKPIDMFFLYGV